MPPETAVFKRIASAPNSIAWHASFGEPIPASTITGVCPYISNDVVLAKRLEELGVHAVMPLASPIGTGKRIASAPNSIAWHASFGEPIPASTITGTFEFLIVKMAEAMKLGIHAGRLSYESGRIPVKYTAQASSPLLHLKLQCLKE
jgi:thiazole synthase ThiGH ThiG subunit